LPQRIEALKRWLENELDFSEYTLNPASSDASFRRYFRVGHDGASYIVMDAPPEREDTRPFVTVDRLLFDVGLNVPEIIDENPGEGYLLLGISATGSTSMRSTRIPSSGSTAMPWRHWLPSRSAARQGASCHRMTGIC
jgi:aminoglycoside/choline kinase family phosphotransferase